MPADGLAWLHKSKLLSYEEIARVAKLFVSTGVKTIRLTGGEPTLRKDLPELVAMLRAIDPGLDLAMTTNGYLLADLAAPLAAAGLNRINVSMDSVLDHRFHDITRRDALQQVMTGLKAAEAAGLRPLKINCVVLRGSNDDEVLDFARLSRATGWEVRFIEFMPSVVPSREIYETINAAFPLLSASRGAEPATCWSFADGAPGSVGVIPSVTEPFCESCNRVRITADGRLRACLFSVTETDLRAPLRSGATDEEMLSLIRSGLWGKQSGHRINQPGFVRPARSMSMIGG